MCADERHKEGKIISFGTQLGNGGAFERLHVRRRFLAAINMIDGRWMEGRLANQRGGTEKDEEDKREGLCRTRIPKRCPELSAGYLSAVFFYYFLVFFPKIVVTGFFRSTNTFQ